MGNPEVSHNSEHGLESLGDAARERAAELIRTPEAGVEVPGRHVESLAYARQEARDAAISHERPGHESAGHIPTAHRVHTLPNKATRAKAYKEILTHTQNELPAASRQFSKVIHQPVVEKTSAVVGSTVARPNAILFGALFALIISGGVYIVARYYGYTLSGFEAIASFIIGWTFGMIVDFVRLALRKR